MPKPVDLWAARGISLAAILDRYGVLASLKRAGRQLKGKCPIHRGTNPRAFVVDLDRDQWRCFGDCDQGGGTFEFVAAMERIEITGAARLISEWLAIVPPRAPPHRQPKQRSKPVSGKPSHKAYAVEDRGEGEDNDAFWTRIGSAWPHKDGKGLNVVLSALPVNGRVVLREYTDDDAKKDEEEKKPASRRK